MKDKIVAILEEEMGDRFDRSFAEIVATRIHSLYTTEISEGEIIDILTKYSDTKLDWIESAHGKNQRVIDPTNYHKIAKVLSKTRNEIPSKDGEKKISEGMTDELLKSINNAQDHNFTNSLDAYYTGCRDGVKVALSRQEKPTEISEEEIDDILLVLDNFLGDTDPFLDDDMNDDDIKQEEPILWAHMKLLDLKQKLSKQAKGEIEECPNCNEKIRECACMRNKCINCGGSVGNITFTYCDKCWDKYHPSKQAKGVSDGNTNVFVRDDCIFKYCPHPEQCKDECQCKADDLNEKIDKSNKIIDKMSDFSNFDMNEPYT